MQFVLNLECQENWFVTLTISHSPGIGHIWDMEAPCNWTYYAEQMRLKLFYVCPNL